MTSNISVTCFYLLIKHCCGNSFSLCQATDNQNAVVCSDPKFFDFASLRIAGDEDSGGKSLSLGSMLKLGYSTGALLQVQASLYGLWFDLLSKSPAPDRFLTCIPDALWQPEILRTLSVDWASLSPKVVENYQGR